MAIAVFPRVASRYARNYARLRWGHWSTQGLVLCCPRASLPVSTEGIRTLGAYSSAAAVFQHPEGINFTNTTHYYELLPIAYQNSLPTQRATALIVLEKTDSTSRNAVHFGSGTGAGTSLHCDTPFGDGLVYLRFGTGGPSVAGLTVTGHRTYAFTGGLFGKTIYQDGLRVANTAGAVTRTNDSSSNMRLNNGSSTNGDLQIVKFFALLDAEWTPAQVMEWSANPWLMFEAPAPAAQPSTGVSPIPVFMHHYREQGIA